jgi:hypothetical protein
MPYLLVTYLVYHGSLDTWTVVHMTAAKFEPLIFSVWGLALSNETNIFIFMILDDFCLLPAWFCYVIINVRWNIRDPGKLLTCTRQHNPRIPATEGRWSSALHEAEVTVTGISGPNCSLRSALEQNYVETASKVEATRYDMGKQCKGEGKYKCVPVTNKELRHEDVWGSVGK